MIVVVILLAVPVTVVGSGTPSLQLIWSRGESANSVLVAVTNNGSIVLAGFHSSISDYVKFYDKEGSQLYYQSLSGSLVSVGISYGGERAFAATGDYIYVFEYQSGSGYSLKKTVDPGGSVVDASISRSTGRVVAYAVNYLSSSYYVKVYDVDLDASYSITLSGQPCCIAVSDAPNPDSGEYVIVVGTASGSVGVYTYAPGSGISSVASVSLPNSNGIVDVDLDRYGTVLAVTYDTSLGDGYVAVYAVDLAQSRLAIVGNSVNVGSSAYTVAVQAASGSSVIVAAGGSDAYIVKADIASNTTETLLSIGGYFNDDQLVDLSFYGSYASIGTTSSQGSLYVVETATRTSDSDSYNYLTSLDMSEDGSVLVIGDSSGNVRYFSTGVSEDLPVPIPEPPLLVSAAVIAAVVLVVFRLLGSHRAQ